jgi:hypothetical protein
MYNSCMLKTTALVSTYGSHGTRSGQLDGLLTTKCYPHIASRNSDAIPMCRAGARSNSLAPCSRGKDFTKEDPKASELRSAIN